MRESLEHAGDRGFALVRPPGHHAEPEKAMGFCLLNHIALAAANVLDTFARVAIVDFDVHHGNGTQRAFWKQPRVFFSSIHQSPFYPGSGANDERGDEHAGDTTLNLPLSMGAGDGVYLAAFDHLLVPSLAAFRPELLLVSAGFDAHERDPLGGMLLTTRGYFGMTQRLAALANRLGIPLGLVLEGGYDLPALSASVEAACEGMRTQASFEPVSLAEAGLHRAQIEAALAAQSVAEE